MGMSAGRGGQQNAAPMTDINTTPLVDVMLVLLIIFMITAPLMQNKIPISIPEAANESDSAEEKAVTLNIQDKGGGSVQFYWVDDPVDADGLLSVAAKEQGSGVEARIDVKPSYGLSDDQVARMLQDSFSTAEQDIKSRALVESRVEADRMLIAIKSALDADGDLLEADVRSRVDVLTDQLRKTAVESHDAAVIEAATKALADATEAFAAQRMNASIRKALAGKKLESI